MPGARRLRAQTKESASALPVLLIIASMLERSFTCRETMMPRSSSNPISPRSNIQCAVPDRAMPFWMLSGPPCSTGLICAASASARPPPLQTGCVSVHLVGDGG